MASNSGFVDLDNFEGFKDTADLFPHTTHNQIT